MSAAAEARLAAYLRELAERYPGFRVMQKRDARLHRVIDRVLRVVTLGSMRAYLDGYQTTIGRIVYVTPDWNERSADQRYVTLRHEAVHLAQFRRFTVPGLFLLYVWLPLPLGLAWCRAYFEREAYAESIRAAAEVWGRAFPRQPAYRAYVIEQFTSASYGWMWPFRRGLERWYDGILAELDTPAS